MQLKVTLIARTQFLNEAAKDATEWVWNKDAQSTDGADLAEFAGRGCYASWTKPNPTTRANADYLAHIQEVGHFNLFEHPTLTFYIEGVSRSLTHELIRHRHFSPSQLSQRFVVLKPDVMERSKEDFVVPPLFYRDSIAEQLLENAWEYAMDAYAALLERGDEIARTMGLTGTAASKAAREAARAVLPNMTPTAITLTGNHRAWREMLLQRLQPEADAEIRHLSIELFQQLSTAEPALYQDLQLAYRGGFPSLQRVS